MAAPQIYTSPTVRENYRTGDAGRLGFSKLHASCLPPFWLFLGPEALPSNAPSSTTGLDPYLPFHVPSHVAQHRRSEIRAEMNFQVPS